MKHTESCACERLGVCMCSLHTHTNKFIKLSPLSLLQLGEKLMDLASSDKL